MVRFPPFVIEQWINEYEFVPDVLDLASSCAAPISLKEISALSTDKTTTNLIEFPDPLLYGDPHGSKTLRQTIAENLGDNPLTKSEILTADDVLVTQGGIAANFAVFQSLLNPGDHVVCIYPTFQQLYTVPATLGADVSLWKLKKDDGYVPDVSELNRLVKPNTKLIVINNPNNPTGVPIPRSTLQQIVDFAKSRDLILLSDEVFSPLYHGLFDNPAAVPPSAVALGYDKVIATGSMSKAFGMAGIRVGWAATKSKAIMDALVSSRQYTTISVSQIDDRIASYALSEAVRVPLLKEKVAIAKTNLGLLEEFINQHSDVCSWVKPTASTVAFVQFSKNGTPVDDEQLGKDLMAKAKLLVVPGGTCFGDGQEFAGFVRIGYVCRTDILKAALEQLGLYLKEHF
ncbi:aminotransferase class I and II [Thelonectria olida]|uniref:Aminotransferase class I and II n=1 Tax=Thelonectria olida TaxID=1576542 RepID=A0A9P8VZI1_9HYPO|nr:aminotransferase class I and II [Thelonectria olida]